MLAIEHLETFGDNTVDFDLDIIGHKLSEEIGVNTISFKSLGIRRNCF